LHGKNSLAEILSATQFFKKYACRELAKLLESPSSKIQTLRLACVDTVDDDCVAILSNALMMNNTVKTLQLSPTYVESSSFIDTVTGWHIFSEVLSRPTSSLETLDIESTYIDNDGLYYLSDALSHNKTLKELNLGGLCGGLVSIAGWRHFLVCLEHDKFALVDLRIHSCDIDDELAASIAKSLSTNTSLKKLDMSYNDSITSAGWVAFFGVLLSCTSCCSLQYMNLRGNKGQKELEIILPRALCDESSIGSIFSSNHTLHTILMNERWSQEIYSLLEMNENNNKWEVAHQKSLRCFSIGEASTAIKEIADLPESVLPLALGWIGRGKDRTGFSLMYKLVHGFPPLVEIRKADDIPPPTGMKKRKRWYEAWWG